MTISAASVRRQLVADWPIFGGVAVPSDFGVLSVEVNRSIDQTIDDAVAGAAEILASSLAAFGQKSDLQLLVVGSPVKRTDRLAAHRARSEKVWGAFERQGLVFPIGPRIDAEVAVTEESFRPAGSISLTLAELEPALSVTRRPDGACVVTGSTVNLLPLLAPTLAKANTSSGPPLLRALLQLNGTWSFVARAFGLFDDRTVGIDVFASSSFLDVLEPIVVAHAEARH